MSAAGRSGRALLRDGAVIGSLSLMTSAAASGGLALVFWSLAARRLDAASMGRVAAEVSTITFLASVGTLNLINVFGRFLPETGARTRRFITLGYLAAAAAGLGVAGIFLLTPWAGDLVIGGTGGRLAFTALVVANSVFMIQDGGLLGLGRPMWVPVENVVVAGARLALLPLLASRHGDAGGLITAWGVPMVLAVLVVNAVILAKLAPLQHGRPSRLPPRGALLRFVAIESVTTAVAASVTAFLPALVAQRLGKEQGAYFYVPWVITTMIVLLASSTLISMVRETVARPEHAAATQTRSLGLLAAVIGLATPICLLLPRLVLWPLGPEYVDEGATLLRWSGLALPAATVVLVYWSICLVARRAWPVFWINMTTATAMVVGVFLIPRSSGIAAVGLLYCLVQWGLAIVVAGPALRSLRRMRAPSAPLPARSLPSP